MNDSNSLCKAHSGILARIDVAEGNVNELWSKWNKMQALLIGTLVSAVLSVFGVLVLLVTTFSK